MKLAVSSITPTDQSQVEGIRQGSTKEHAMSSQLNNELIRARQLAASCAHQQHQRNLGEASERSRRLLSTRRQRTVAVAIGLALACASGACEAAANGAQNGTTSQAPAPSTPVREVHVGSSQRALQARIRELEARGYVGVACTATGTRMVNPRTHRSETVVA
jgi:hypothetical protein